jgi:putative transposase
LDYQTKVSFIVPRDPNVSLNFQTGLLDISRSHFYYQPVQASSDDIRIMNLVDKTYTDYPFYGSRRITDELKKVYHERVNRKRIRSLMRSMGLDAVYPKPRLGLSDPAQEHKKYPYLLKGLPILRPNQVWGTDITYIKLKDGFCYLVALLDWFSRYVIGWQLSETLEINFCLENLATALKSSIPEIHNSDQGSHFTSPQYTDILTGRNIQISMDGRGRCMDNIFTERLWRTIKYENVYLHDYQNSREARTGIGEYLEFYNHKRRHQSLDYQTPARLYFQN